MFSNNTLSWISVLVAVVLLSIILHESDGLMFTQCGKKYTIENGEPMILSSDGQTSKRKCSIKIKVPKGATAMIQCPMISMSTKGCKKERIVINKKSICPTGMGSIMMNYTGSTTIKFQHIRKKLAISDCSKGYVCGIILHTMMTTSTSPITSASTSKSMTKETSADTTPNNTTMSSAPSTTTKMPSASSTTTTMPSASSTTTTMPTTIGSQCSCGKMPLGPLSTTRILNGKETLPHQLPWAGRVEVLDSTGAITGYCAITLIHQNWGLTSLFCLTGSSFRVVFGDHYIDQTESSEIKMDIPGSNIFVKFNSTTRIDNFVLLKFPQAVTFSDKVSPICLDDVGVIEGNITFAGWGVEIDGNFSKVLKYGEASLFSPGACSQIMNALTVPTKYPIDEDMQMCFVPNQQKDACKGDVGAGMMQVNSDGCMVMVGLDSYFYSCGLYPHIITRIFAIKDIINRIIDSN